MKPILILSLLATALLPAAAQAHGSRGELYRDRQDIREERDEYRDALRYGSRHDIREERDEYRDARREYREDARDWRGDRHDRLRGNEYPRYGYRNYGYQNYGYQGRDYRLPRAGYGTRWVRHHHDILLIDIRTGYVRNVIRGYYR
jgi:Ni/Co efflux regulator RcnB